MVSHVSFFGKNSSFGVCGTPAIHMFLRVARYDARICQRFDSRLSMPSSRLWKRSV